MAWHVQVSLHELRKAYLIFYTKESYDIFEENLWWFPSDLHLSWEDKIGVS